ncbi:hypothetical protein [Nonomuraea dietziae]|uniref:hypothetical protein n=1 Tax=Nonomuraea dietziae TaxID=65515 RepID=UPI003414B942
MTIVRERPTLTLDELTRRLDWRIAAINDLKPDSDYRLIHSYHAQLNALVDQITEVHGADSLPRLLFPLKVQLAQSRIVMATIPNDQDARQGLIAAMLKLGHATRDALGPAPSDQRADRVLAALARVLIDIGNPSHAHVIMAAALLAERDELDAREVSEMIRAERRGTAAAYAWCEALRILSEAAEVPGA